MFKKSQAVSICTVLRIARVVAFFGTKAINMFHLSRQNICVVFKLTRGTTLDCTATLRVGLYPL